MQDEKLVTSFEEACAEQEIDPVKVLPDVSCLPEQDRAAVIAHIKMFIIHRSLNKGWVPDWADDDQYKYYPWFDVVEDESRPSGFGLSCRGYDGSGTYTYLGDRLFYRNAKTARYAGETFTELYEALILLPKQ